MSGGATKTLDILHPSSTLEWEERPSLPVEMSDAQAVVLDGTLHVGGGNTGNSNSEDNAVVYSSKLVGDNSWTSTNTPTSHYALTTYDSNLLLVGGKEYPSGQRTNKVYTMTDGEFKQLVPPMQEKKESPSAVTSGSVLVVAGGYGDSGWLSSVEVYKDGHWSYEHSLPDACCDATSAVHGDTYRWVLMGGERQGTKVFSVSLKSLVSGTEQSPWETLPDVPSQCSAAAVIGGRIVAIGGEGFSNPTSSIYAYSPDIRSWVHVGEIPAPLFSVYAVVLQKELIVLGLEEFETGKFLKVFRAAIEGPTYKRSNVDDDDYLVKQVVLESENEYLKDEVEKLKSSLSAKSDVIKQKAKVLMAESDATIKIYKEKVQQLFSENQTLCSELTLPAPVETEAPFTPPTEVLMAESDATIKMYKEKVRQLLSKNQTLLSENQTLRSQLALPALPAPVKTGAPFNLPGVEVVGQTSVTVTNSRLSFHWSGYGFKLNIPQGSLPAGVDQCLLHISASTAGQYQFPDNMELVSAVYWVRCEPFCQFQQPLTAELQHCAKMTSSTNLTFVRAVCSQKILPYRFKKLEVRGSFTDQSSYGFLQLDRFSGIAVAGEGEKTGEDIERLYIASLYYLVKDLHYREINFVITWDHEIHANKVKQFFEEKGAEERLYMKIEFKEKDISLDIPTGDGVLVDEWKLIAMASPHLSRKWVDSYQPGNRIPSLKLKAILPDDWKEPVPRRSYVATLQGAREPYNEMVIEIDPFKYKDDQNLAQSTKQLLSPSTFAIPGQFNMASLTTAIVLPGVHQLGSLGVFGGRSLSIAGPSSDIPKTSFTFENLERELKPVIRWHRLGTNLGIPQETLKAIKLDNPDVDSQKIAFVDLIVRNYQFSWEDICKALETMDESNLATKIRSKYCNKDTANSESSSQDQPTNSTSPPDDL